MLNKAILGSRPTFRITVSAGSGGTASVNKQYAAEGETVTISISPYSNYVISSVSVPGATVSGSGYTRTFKMPAQNVTVSVMFTYVAPTYSISLSVGANGSARLSQSSAPAGTRIYIYCTPNSGYEVSSVTGGVPVSGSGTIYYFTMPGYPVSFSVSFDVITRIFNVGYIQLNSYELLGYSSGKGSLSATIGSLEPNDYNGKTISAFCSRRDYGETSVFLFADLPKGTTIKRLDTGKTNTVGNALTEGSFIFDRQDVGKKIKVKIY